MCGVAALITRAGTDLRPRIEAMTETLVHRGPDDFGYAVIPEDGVALGMRRLSILDLECGQQPMWNERRDIAVVFNGEIYNFAPLRRELESLGHRFATDHSDTEVLVHGYEEWGRGLPRRLRGMFAFVVWDGRQRRLFAARDRTGKKPLYVAEIPGGYALASELKALLELRELDRSVDITALEQYLSFDYVLGSRTILKRVRKLLPAHSAVLTATGWNAERYWTPCFERSRASEAELAARLDAALDEAVRLRMVADVPVGLLLSGGLDSATIGWYMRRHDDEVHSFSIGFEEDRFDESRYAALAADHLGTRHHLEVFSQARVRELVPRVIDILDEPMGDQSIFPTYLLSKVVRQSVKVALGGDGSDELLMGYRAYQALKVSWYFDRIPLPLRRAVAASARRAPARVGGVPLRGVRFAGRLDRRPAHRLLSHLGSFKGDARWILAPELRRELGPSPFREADEALLDGVAKELAPPEESIAAYLHGYLPSDILVKVDRASMAASLEVRSPFLDAVVVDAALAIPPGLKLRGMTRKYLLRRIMRGRIPDELIDRPKLGFGVPLNTWLRESLAGDVREALAPDRVTDAGFFDPTAVSRLVEEHMSGHADRGLELWLLWQFELWRERWLQ